MQYHNNMMPMQSPSFHAAPNQLPFSAQRLEVMPFQVNPNNPPFVPQVIIEDFLKPYLPFAAGLTAATIIREGSNQPAHAVRIFMYNQCIQNNFMNPDFESLVSNIMNLVAHQVMVERKFTADPNGIQMAITQAVTMVCELWAVNNVRQYSGLQHFMTPDDANRANKLVALYDQIGQSIQNLHNMRRQQQATQGGFQAVGNMQQVHTNPAYTNGFSGGHQNRYQGTYNPHGQSMMPMQQPNGYGYGMQVNPNQNAGLGGNTTTGLFRDTPASQGGAMAEASVLNDVYGDRWATPSNPAPVQAAPSNPIIEQFGGGTDSYVPSQDYGSSNQTWNSYPSDVPVVKENLTVEQFTQAPVQTEAQEVVEEENPVVKTARHLTPEAKNFWKPSKEYPALPAYNPKTHYLELQQLKDGIIVPVMKQKSEEEIMNYNKHDARMTVLPKEYTFRDSELRQQAIEDSMKQPAVVLDNSAIDEFAMPESFMAVVQKGMTMDVSLDSLWNTHKGSLVQAEAHGGTLPPVFRTYGLMVKPFRAQGDQESEMIQELLDAGTYEEAFDVLLKYVNSVNREFWLAVEKALSDAVNTTIAARLCIPGLSLESFHDDIKDMIQVIASQHGADMISKFTGDSTTTIRRAIQVLDSSSVDMAKELFVDCDDLPEGKDFDLGYIAVNYSMTTLQCMAEELDIVLDENNASVILRRANPLLYSIVSQIFEDQEISMYATVLLRTADGVVFELNKGLFNDEFITIRKL